MSTPVSPGPIRILHIVETMLGMGGLERGVVNLINRLDPARFEHVVCVVRSLGALTEELPRDRVRVVCLNHTQAGFSFLGGMFTRVIRDVRPHVVHTRNWGTAEGIFAGAVTRSCGLVHSEHGIESATPDPLKRRILRRLVFEAADRVCAVSHDLQAHHARQTGFSPRRITVIHNGVDTSVFHRDDYIRAIVRRQHNVADNELCIGYVGRLEPIKDPLTLLRAVEGLPNSLEWRLLVAGDGSEQAAARDFVARRPAIEGRVTFVGEIEKVPAFLNALDLYVLPSRYEGICNSLLECMATQLPVVATSAGGNPEVVTEGTSGLLVPVGDHHALATAIARIAGDAQLSQRLSHGAGQRIREHFSIASMASRYAELYTSVAAKRVARSGAVGRA